MDHSLLAVFAHPDDEAFATGGTLSCYTAEGTKVYLVCATRGEVGEISDPIFASPETLGEVRENELRCAAETMGISELIFLGYRDSGMDGSAENTDPRAFINAPEGEVVTRLVNIIRRLRPEIIVTFEPNGGYGHPDHIAIHKHTLTAFHAAANPDRFTELGPAWQAKRLFYSTIPRSFFIELRQRMEERGLDSKELESFDNPDIGWPDDLIHVKLDVFSSVEEKWEALNCHRTQFGPGNLFRRLPEEQVKELMRWECFSLAWPEPSPNLVLANLFDSIG